MTGKSCPVEWLVLTYQTVEDARYKLKKGDIEHSQVTMSVIEWQPDRSEAICVRLMQH